MTGTHRFDEPKGRSRWSAPLVGVVAAGLCGCGGLLDVTNPNNVPAGQIEDPQAAAFLVNGAQRQVSFGVTSMLLVYSTATDELDWVGSRDGWRELEQGKLSNGYNEFTDGAFPGLAQGRWLADEAVKVLEAQQTAATLVNPQDLARAYLWASMAYVTIADMFDDWALSNLQEAAPPVGPDNMGSLYDTAIGYLNKALPLAGTGTTGAELARQIRAMRARASFSRAVWDLVGKRPISASRLVNASSSYVTNAVTDAQAVLAGATATYTFRFTYTATIGRPDPGAWINQRQEMRVGRAYANPVGAVTWGTTSIRDPIDVTKAPAVVDAVQAEWGTGYPPHTMLSAREMHLIVAEARLAAGDVNGFATAINALRALDGLTAWNSVTPQIPAEDLLLFSRRTNLFLQGRRLADHYRFRSPPIEWSATSQAITSPGTFLPITAIECLSNPNIGPTKCST